MSPAAPPGPPLPHCPAATFLDCPAACWQPRPAATDLPHGVWQAHNVCAEVQQALGNHLTLHEAEGGCHEGGLTLPVHPARVQQGWQRRRASTRVTMGRMMRTCRGRERDAAWRRDGALAIQPCDGLANARTCLPACAPAAPAARLVRILLHALARLAIAIPVARVGGGWGGVGGWGGGGDRLPALGDAAAPPPGQQRGHAEEIMRRRRQAHPTPCPCAPFQRVLQHGRQVVDQPRCRHARRQLCIVAHLRQAGNRRAPHALHAAAAAAAEVRTLLQAAVGDGVVGAARGRQVAAGGASQRWPRAPGVLGQGTVVARPRFTSDLPVV